ncbi:MULTISPECIES: hypothetical protein [Shewanella]|uniref:Uncharacterized protein n=2 Tax=Shewanella TaxID=22 RepID=A0A974XNY5_9GAMM|nr:MULTISPECIES: hypothetical protein [Shewanella]QSX30748.1 hypothetical protein JYB88_03550 [Shewanella cyperi]QSX37961.1 hypothetical protein JYB85_03725 [Shewanella sedimentimangrovi]QSX41525.1 hypothetical protein JYB84_03565 [Shewanella cyperi]
MSCKQKAAALENRLAQQQQSSPQNRISWPLKLACLTLALAAVVLLCYLD